MCVPSHSRYSYKNSQKITREKIIFYLVLFWLYMPCQVKKLACQCRRHERCGFDPWVGKIPWRRAWDSCLGKLMDRGARRTTVHSITESTLLKRLRTAHSTGMPRCTLFRITSASIYSNNDCRKDNAIRISYVRTENVLSIFCSSRK